MLHAEGDATALANNPFGFSTKYHDAELPGIETGTNPDITDRCEGL